MVPVVREGFGFVAVRGRGAPITHQNNCTNPNTSPAKTFGSYTWPDSVAPSSTNITPFATDFTLTYHRRLLGP